MPSLAIYTDHPRDIARLNTVLAGAFPVEVFEAGRMAERRPGGATLLDIDLRDAARLPAIKAWLARRPKGSKAIFVVDAKSHLETVRAHGIGATHVLPRPISRRKLLACLGAPEGEPSDTAAPAGDATLSSVSPLEASVDQAFGALNDAFDAVRTGTKLDMQVLLAAGQQIVTQIEQTGLDNWMNEVRKHHSQTYQHCLLVTGVAVAFGQHLQLPEEDCLRLSLAGMLHDIGKARIPLSILDKPGPLDYAEALRMRGHPVLGGELLGDNPDIPGDVRDAVLHHHEFLDGSGYPHGLAGRQISEIVRIMTISDIFGALIERRAYKAPMSNAEAYGILQGMGRKLDQDLLRKFAFVAQTTPAAAEPVPA